MHIINQVHGLQPPGRFLIEDTSDLTSEGWKADKERSSGDANVHAALMSKVWIPVEMDKVFLKILHRLREKEALKKIEEQIDVKKNSLLFDESEKKKSLGSASDPANTNTKQQVMQENSDRRTSQEEKAEDEWGSMLNLISLMETKDGGGCPNEQRSKGPNQTDSKTSEEWDPIPHRIHTPKKDEGGIYQRKKPLVPADAKVPPGKYFQPVTDITTYEQELDGSRKIISTSTRDALVEEVDLSSQDFEQSHDLTLRQWTDRAKYVTAYTRQLFDQATEYVKSALFIALKLTERLIEAEKDEKNGLGNPIPLASIVAGNVSIRAKECDSTEGPVNGETNKEVIEYVWFMRCFGNTSDLGGEMPRLFALGILLYELFAGEEPLLEYGTASNSEGASYSLSMNSIHLNDEAQRPQKKSQKQPSKISNCILRLESIGIPFSLCALVKNLLDCSNGDFCGDNAYISLVDLQMDLQLMLDDPSRFLDNIETNPMPALEVCDKLYGREDEIATLEQLYEHHINGGCSGVIISGGAGVGKSKLAMHVLQDLANQSKGYLLDAKFDQNKDTKPLFVIGNMFNSLCNLFEQDASPTQLKSVENALESALGSQAGLLVGVVPSLSKLLPSCVRLETSNNCVDAALSMRFLLGKLLTTISSHSSRPILLFLDDIQWSDFASLLLAGHLLSIVESSSNLVFFAFCHRNNEGSRSGQFDAWISSISIFNLETIKLNNISVEALNKLVSDALHLSPRITRPLSSILHHKTGGNPLFVRQLLDSLKDQSYIYFNLNPPRWAWDLEKIMNLKISDDVVVLLVTEMQRLPSDLQLGLKVASCMGNQVKYTVLEILSKTLKRDLVDILRQVTAKGFMNHAAGAMFSFAHDKIQQAAYELMTEDQKRESHKQYGVALCVHALSDNPESNELIFTAVNQVNRGGESAIHDPYQKSMIAALNLKAGELAINRSEYNTAYQLFGHGISFLGDGHWTTHYRLSINLFDAAAEAACVLNKATEVNFYSDQLITNAKTFDDKVNCLCTAAKVLRHANRLKESMQSIFEIIQQLGEELPRLMGDGKLSNDIRIMNGIIENTPYDTILNMAETSEKKIITLMKIYSDLVELLHFAEPSFLGAVGLQMVNLTLKYGLTSMSPLAFCCYGEMLAATGNLTEGCRLGRLALKLCENWNSSRYKSFIICIVYQSILWASDPLQQIAEAHMLGRKAGQQSGDLFYASLNLALSTTTSYVAGQSLDSVRESNRDYIREMQSQNHQTFIPYSILFYSQSLVLKEGLHILDADRFDINIPTERELLASPRFGKHKIHILWIKIHQVVRAFLFHQLNGISFDTVNISGEVREKNHFLRPFLLFGIFFEGLASYHLARQMNEIKEWVERGNSVLENMKEWSLHSSWNFEAKKLLLEAEKMHTIGNFEGAASFYQRAIQSAHEHKFIHEEAIASELAGIFFYGRGLYQKSLDFLAHSVQAYKKWGAAAVAKRVETSIASKYGLDFMHLKPGVCALEYIFESGKASSKRPLGREGM